jgi:hypothetical protein
VLRDLREARRQLLDAAVGERSEIVHRAAERRERRPAGLVGLDTVTSVRPAAPAAAPFRAGQVLEAVREDRLPAKASSLVGDALGGAPAEEIAVPQMESASSALVSRVEGGEPRPRGRSGRAADSSSATVASSCVCEAAEPGRAPEPVQRLARKRAPDDQRPLRVCGDGTRLGASSRDAVEDVVEGADRAGQERRLQLEQVALDALDVRPVRHDQARLIAQSREVTAQQERHLPGVRRAGDQVQTHN